MNSAESVLFSVLKDSHNMRSGYELSPNAKLALVKILKEAARKEYINILRELENYAPERKPRVSR